MMLDALDFLLRRGERARGPLVVLMFILYTEYMYTTAVCMYTERETVQQFLCSIIIFPLSTIMYRVHKAESTIICNICRTRRRM